MVHCIPQRCDRSGKRPFLLLGYPFDDLEESSRVVTIGGQELDRRSSLTGWSIILFGLVDGSEIGFGRSSRNGLTSGNGSVVSSPAGDGWVIGDVMGS